MPLNYTTMRMGKDQAFELSDRMKLYGGQDVTVRTCGDYATFTWSPASQEIISGVFELFLRKAVTVFQTAADDEEYRVSLPQKRSVPKGMKPLHLAHVHRNN